MGEAPRSFSLFTLDIWSQSCVKEFEKINWLCVYDGSGACFRGRFVVMPPKNVTNSCRAVPGGECPAAPTGDPRLRRIFARGTLRQKLPKPNRAIWGILENTLSNRPATKKCLAGLPGARNRQKLLGRALTVRQLFVTFSEGITTKRPLKHARLPS